MDNNKLYDALEEVYRQGKEKNTAFARAEVVKFVNNKLPGANFTDDFTFNEVLEDFNSFAKKNIRNLDPEFFKYFVNNDNETLLFVPKLLGIKSENFDGNTLMDTIEEIQSVNSGNILGKTINRINPEKIVWQYLDSVENELKETDWFNKLTGSNKVAKKQIEAEAIYSNYDNLLEYYDSEKYQLFVIFSQFSEIRDSIFNIWKELLELIIEIYGDQIKSSNPELFTISEDDFINTESIRKKVELYFNNIVNQCQTFIKNHNDEQFSQYKELATKFTGEMSKSLSQVNISDKSDWKNASKNIAGSLIENLFQAGGQAILAQIESSNMAIALENDIQKMRNAINEDSFRIINDLNEIKVVAVELETRLLPGFSEFLKYLKISLSEKIDGLIKELYNNEKVKELKKKKQTAIKEKKKNKKLLEDIELNIPILKEIHHQKLSDVEIWEEKWYNVAIKKMPKKPGIIGNILTIGLIQIFYLLAKSKWNESGPEIIEKWEDLVRIEYVANNKLNETLKLQNDYISRNAELDKDIANISKELIQTINQNPLKKDLDNELGNVINVLKQSKKILSTTLK